MRVYVCSHVCVCTRVWRSEVDVTYLLPSLAILRQGLLLNLELDDLADLVSQLAWGISVSSAPMLGLQSYCAPQLLCGSWGSGLVIAQQTLYPRSILLALPFYCFICHSDTQRLWNLQGQSGRTTQPDVSPVSETEAEVCG